MSKEQEALDKPKPTQEQLLSDALAYLEGASVGDPRYIAFSDFFENYELQGAHMEHVELVQKSEKNSDRYNALMVQSQLRITEGDIVALNRDIREKSSTIPGYKKAYYHVRAVCGELSESTIYQIVKKILEPTEE